MSVLSPLNDTLSFINRNIHKKTKSHGQRRAEIRSRAYDSVGESSRGRHHRRIGKCMSPVDEVATSSGRSPKGRSKSHDSSEGSITPSKINLYVFCIGKDGPVSPRTAKKTISYPAFYHIWHEDEQVSHWVDQSLLVH